MSRAPGLTAPGAVPGLGAARSAAGSAAADLVRAVADPGSWQPWEGELPGDRAAADESVVTGSVSIGGRRAALLVSDFGHLGGSVGVTAAGRLARAIANATRRRLPLIAMPASGGTRMQDGTLAFLRMIDIVGLLAEHRAAGLPYLVYLRNPTTGGVLASWGSLGQVAFAEPGALIGFLGPRVHEVLAPGALPRSVQRAENLADHGVVDAVVAPVELRGALASVLAVLAPSAREESRLRPEAASGGAADGASGGASGGAAGAGTNSAAGGGPGAGSAWDSVLRTRDPARPGAGDLLAAISRRTVRLSGTGSGEHDRSVLLALADVGGRSCVVVAHDRTSGRLPGPGGLRTARRGMRLAAELRLPLLTIVDTAGAELSAAAEEGALAGEIARSLYDLVTLPSPTLSVLLGQGGGGAALALVPADRTIAARSAWLAPLPPEGASALVHRDVAHAAAVADAQHITSGDLLAARAVDRVVDDLPAASDTPDDPASFLSRLADAVSSELAAVASMKAPDRLAARRSRYAHLGSNPPR